MDITPIPCLKDNYAYLLVCPTTGEAAVVDPSEFDPVKAEIERQGVQLTTILNTHHHWDHVGGNKALRNHFGQLAVVGHHSDRGRIPGQTVFLDGEDPVHFGQVTGHFTHNPGHTTGAITFYFGDAAFTGDTLFAAGCGRLFEGTPAQMQQSLCNQIGRHDDSMRLFFGHEYTENNLRFAQSVEPNNPDITARLEAVRAKRANGEFTTPSTLAEEWATNPFMRHDSAELQATVKHHEPDNDLQPASVLRVVRELKDNF